MHRERKRCNVPGEKTVQCTGRERGAKGGEERERRNAPNAGETEGGKPALTGRATSPQRDLSQGAMGGSRLFGKSTYCVRLTWRRAVRALPWAWLECPDMSG